MFKNNKEQIPMLKIKQQSKIESRMKPLKTTDLFTGIICAMGLLVVIAALILRLLEVLV